MITPGQSQPIEISQSSFQNSCVCKLPNSSLILAGKKTGIGALLEDIGDLGKKWTACKSFGGKIFNEMNDNQKQKNFRVAN